MKPYRRPDSMKKYERQRFDWFSIRKKALNEDKNHLLRGWLAKVCMFVCPGTNTGQGDLDREKGRKLEAVRMDTASPAAQGGRRAREGREGTEGRKGLGQKREGADRWTETRKEHTWMWQASTKTSGKSVFREDENYNRWKKSRRKHQQLQKQKQRARPYRSTPPPPPIFVFELSFSVLFCSPPITVKSANSVSCLLPVLSPSKGGF